MRRLCVRSSLLCLLLGPATFDAAPALAQAPAPADTARAFLDAGAATLLRRARDAKQAADDSLLSYTALVRSRMAGDMRMPLKDRNLIRHEGAARVRWSRDGEDLVQILGSRTQTPVGVHPGGAGWPGSTPFDPSSDRLYFGMMQEEDQADDDDYWIEHPLGEGAERHYRYQSGDTMVIRLQDGRAIRIVELRVIPRRTDPHTVRGVLSLDLETGALVRGAFRLARKVDIIRDTNAIDDDDMRTISRIPLVTPMEFDISLMTVEYALWELKHWLPRTMRLEGMGRAGVFTFPGVVEISYDMQEVVTATPAAVEQERDRVQQVLREWQEGGDYRTRSQRYSRHARTRVMTPREGSAMLEHELLPPPVWSTAAGFPTEAELRRIYDRVAAVPLPARHDIPVHFGWGWGEPGMIRYNRVEALSVGARLAVPLWYANLEATARLGVGDLHPNAAIEARRETMHRTITLRGYHELATVEPNRRAFGAGNSLSAALLGRDEGEYFRTTGAALSLGPPPIRRQWWEAGVYIERQDSVRRTTHVSLPRLWNDSVFRPNITAYETVNYGGRLQLRPWWGRDPRRAQFGIDLLAQYEFVDFDETDRSWVNLPREHVWRARAIARGAVPLAAGIRAGVEVGAGIARGSLDHSGFASVPPQRLFYLGGASTLRGYEPGTLSGPEMVRGRLELARTFPIAGIAVFTDYGRTSSEGNWTSELWAAGAGVTVLDGLIRVDFAHGIGGRRGWQAQAARRGLRVDLHLDAVL